MAGRSTKELIIKRREVVASLLVRGLTQSEIVNTLNQSKYTEPVLGNGNPNPYLLVNPQTGEPFDKSTVSRDVKAIREEWLERARENADLWFAEQLAGLKELWRVNWAAKDFMEARQVMALMIKLTGTSRPERKELSWEKDQFDRMHTDDLKELSDAELAAIAISGGG